MPTTKKQIKTSEELEKDFLEAVEKANKEIKEQLKVAQNAINKAERLAEKYGVPFTSSISPIGNQYTPESFEKKWGKIDPEKLVELLEEVELDCDEPGGWTYSAAC